MKQSSMFVPGNISLIFKICTDENPAIAGSLGVGFTINKGVKVSVEKVEVAEVVFNNKKIEFPTVDSVVEKLLNSSSKVCSRSDESRNLKGSKFSTSSNNKNIRVHIVSDLPLGCGFGLSGASALGTAYAINDLFKLQKTTLELAKIAHITEVENGTGLGDVVNEYFGGFLLKTVPSSQFRVQKLPILNIPVYVKYFSKLSTKELISDPQKRIKIDLAGEKALAKVNDLILRVSPFVSLRVNSANREVSYRQARTITNQLFSKILTISKQFAIESGLLQDKQVIQTIQQIESQGGRATMIMLGNAIVSDIPFEGSTQLIIS